ncbi:hypothetical protein QUQ58_004623 [Escherichia coli]|nr:hypothetical protein [Escherichia coli]
MIEKITEKNIANIFNCDFNDFSKKINDKIKKKIKNSESGQYAGIYVMQLNIIDELKKINAKKNNDFHDISATKSLNASAEEFKHNLSILQPFQRKGRIEEKEIINSDIIAQNLQRKIFSRKLSMEATIDSPGKGSNPGKLSAASFLAQQKGTEQPVPSTYSEKVTVASEGNDFLARHLAQQKGTEQSALSTYSEKATVASEGNDFLARHLAQQKGTEQSALSTYSEKATVASEGNDFLARHLAQQKGTEQSALSTYSEKATVASEGNDFLARHLAQQKGTDLFSLSHREKVVNRTAMNPLVQQFKRNEFSNNASETELINSMKMKPVENGLRTLSVLKNFHRDGLLNKLTERDIKNNAQLSRFAHNAASFEYQFNRWNGNHSVRVFVQTNDNINFIPSDEQTSGLLSKNITNLAGFHTKTIEPYNRDEEQRGQQRQPWASEREDE